MAMIVLCWGYETRMDEMGGVGYSVHATEEGSKVWTTNMNKVGNKRIPNHMEGTAIYHVCGSGKIETPSEELLSKLGSQDGIYLENQPEGFALICGRTPEEFTADFLDEVDSGPD